ncbi:MAG: recombinase family protein [Candidatus Acidiferrum sp.]
MTNSVTGQRHPGRRSRWENQAPTVHRMFERYACGDSMKRIAKDRSRDGISSPQPQKGRVARSWAQSSVRHILLNESYRGVVFWQDEQSPFAGNRQVHLPTPTVEHHGFPHRSNAPVKLVRSHK